MFLYLQIISALVRLSFGLPMKGAKTQRYNTVMTGYTPRTANHIISSPVLLRREPGGRLRSQCQPGQTTQCRQATRFTSSACVTRARDRCVRNGTGAAPRRTHRGTRAAGSELGRAQERRRKRALRRKDPSSSQKLASLARDAGRYRRPASSVAVRLADYHHARDTCKGFNNAFTLQAKNSIEKGPLREDVLSIGTQNSRNCRRREAAGTHGYDETAQIKMQIVVK